MTRARRICFDYSHNPGYCFCFRCEYFGLSYFIRFEMVVYCVVGVNFHSNKSYRLKATETFRGPSDGPLEAKDNTQFASHRCSSELNLKRTFYKIILFIIFSTLFPIEFFASSLQGQRRSIITSINKVPELMQYRSECQTAKKFLIRHNQTDSHWFIHFFHFFPHKKKCLSFVRPVPQYRCIQSHS